VDRPRRLLPGRDDGVGGRSGFADAFSGRHRVTDASPDLLRDAHEGPHACASPDIHRGCRTATPPADDPTATSAPTTPPTADDPTATPAPTAAPTTAPPPTDAPLLVAGSSDRGGPTPSFGRQAFDAIQSTWASTFPGATPEGTVLFATGAAALLMVLAFLTARRTRRRR